MLLLTQQMAHTSHTIPYFMSRHIPYYILQPPSWSPQTLANIYDQKIKWKLIKKIFFLEKKSKNEIALKNSGYHNAELKLHKEEQNSPKWKGICNIMLLNFFIGMSPPMYKKHSLI